MESSEASQESRFTPRESSVLSLLMQGASNKQMAVDLACSVKTIEFHITNLLRKAGVSSRLELVVRRLGS